MKDLRVLPWPDGLLHPEHLLGDISMTTRRLGSMVMVVSILGVLVCLLLSFSSVYAHPLKQQDAEEAIQDEACGNVPRLTPGNRDLGIYDPANPDPRDGRNLEGELNPDQKQDAFDEVTDSAGGFFEAFEFRIRTLQGDRGNFMPPIILRSMAGIESDWLQYETRFENNPGSGVRTIRAGCDYGIMQTNSVLNAGFFGENGELSLRRDTRANIAAGAEILAGWWDQGILADLPIVNDADPSDMINWYYALSSYNGGPGGSDSWANNPNCTPQVVAFNCHGNDFTASRNPNTPPWVWTSLLSGSFPYQERVLYNIDTPKQPFGLDAQWEGVDLGLNNSAEPRNYGIRPDDAVFLNDTTGKSRAPDLLLFRTKIGVVNQEALPAEITIEYDLPIEAVVTIDLLDGNNNTVETLLNEERRQPEPGNTFNVEQFAYSDSIGPDYGYRIRAEINGFEGEYIRPLRIVGDAFDPPDIVFLPLVRR